jgi:Flp pilus assembly protein TadD
MRTTRTLALSAALLLATSTAHAQGMARRGGAGASQYTPGVASSLSSTLDVPTSLQPPSSPAPAGIVAVRDLLLPPKAVKEFDRSMKALNSDDLPSAANHLVKAIQIAPDFFQARNNLGAVYIRLRQYDNAVVQLQRTIELNPGLAPAYNNLAMAMLLLERLSEAEAVARRAVDLAPQESSPNYTLGRILVVEGRNTPEAVQLLTHAATDIPEARLSLALVLQNRAEIDRAISELRTYLQSPNPFRKKLVQAWLTQLAKHSPSQSGAPAQPPNS